MSSTTVPSKRMGPRVLNVIAALVIVIAGLKAAQAILIPFLFAIFLAILGSLPVTFLQRNRVPKLVAVAFVAICMISVFVAIGAVLGGSV